MENIKLNRVPHIIFLYWLIKIASTTLGETGADMFSMTFAFGYGETIVIFLILFLLLLIVKLMIKKYNPAAYWSVFTASAILGTAISDFIDRTLGLGYTTGSLFLIILLLLILFIWYKKEHSVSVEHITTTSAEIFYWTAFLIANTLGTALGDFLADSLGFGFLFGSLLISGFLLISLLLYLFTKTSRVLLFWIAFVLTRPFGATFGDFLTKPVEHGGLNLGTIGSSLFFAIVLFICLLRENKVEKAKTV